ncbi:MAG: PAS domain-containing sensor histidine kinase, partial [Acidobacteriota bacterium]|nr:PAS domain-containing sensor histidine kinase [Acidobacteriota bacterium]
MAARRNPKNRRLDFERRLLLLALCAGFPSLAAVVVLLLAADYSAGTIWTLLTVLVVAWLGFALAVRERVAYSMRTLANLLGAVRDGDF